MKRALLALPVLLLAGGAFWFWQRQPLLVEVARAERDVALRVFGLGTIEAQVLSRVGFEVPGVLTELAADHGDQVAAGAVLARLDSASQRARLARAEAALASAQAHQGRVAAVVERATAQYLQKRSIAQRRRELANRGTASVEATELAETEATMAQADLAVANAELAVARAALADAEASLLAERTTLAKHELRAPYGAIVIARHREAGVTLAPGEPIFTLIPPGSLWALAHVDEARAGRIAEGQPATVRLRSLPGESFSARVVRIGLESDRTTEERRVNLRCERCPERPVIGEQISVEIETGRLAEARLVPEAAVLGFDGSEGTAWVVENGALQRRRLRFSARTLDSRLALAPETPHDLAVVTRVQASFREGLPARPLP